MASSLLDVCRFTAVAGGTTDWAYSSAVTGYQSPSAAAVVNGATYSYRAESADLSQWEVGTGVYNTGTNTLSRAVVLFNSSGTTTKISFSAAPQVAVVALKEDLQPVITTVSTILGADVLLSSANTYFDGPSIAQGTSGTWYVTGTVTIIDTTVGAGFNAKLWDGTTVIASGSSSTAGANFKETITLTGIITSPAGNIKISVSNTGSTNGKILFNNSGNSKDSSVVGVRIA